MTDVAGPNDAPDLNRPVHPQHLPATAAEARLRRAADDAAHEPIARPRIEANLTACKLVLDRLQSLHARVADTTDLEILGYSRPSAVWLMAGRCLGLLRAFLVQVEAGICGEAVPTYRALHEADQVLAAFCDDQEDPILRKWLDDEGQYVYVTAAQARAALQRSDERAAEVAREAGVSVDDVSRGPEAAGELYDQLSRAGHNRRSWAVDAVWEPGREMAYGYHPSPIRRAAYASAAVGITEEVTNIVGYALRGFLGPTVRDEEIEPLLRSLKAVAESSPLDVSSIRDAGRRSPPPSSTG